MIRRRNAHNGLNLQMDIISKYNKKDNPARVLTCTCIGPCPSAGERDWKVPRVAEFNTA